MPENTNVNNNSSVVVVGRTAPVPTGQQSADKSIPVVIASDQSAIPVEEQNKQQSEVALSLLGIPRSEVALGIFADVNTYDVNPTEWTATPVQLKTVLAEDRIDYDGIPGQQDWGLSHVPSEAGAHIEAPATEFSILTSKRFFRYQQVVFLLVRLVLSLVVHHTLYIQRLIFQVLVVITNQIISYQKQVNR